MARSDVIQLIAVTVTGWDDNGLPQETETARQVFCRVASVSQSEYFGGGRNGLNPAYKFTVFAGDYAGESIVRYQGKRYAVYRTFQAPGRDELELYVERKGGTNGYEDASG